MTEPETRAVRRARDRMTRGGRKGAKAAVLLARWHAAQDVESVMARRASRRAAQSRRGVMPHVPSGRHQRKIAERREARDAEIMASGVARMSGRSPRSLQPLDEFLKEDAMT